MTTLASFLDCNRYLFDCVCPACEQDWPPQDHLPSKVKGLPKAAYLGKEDAVKKGLSKLATLLQGRKKNDPNGDDPDEALRFHRNLCYLSGSLLRRPHALLITAEDDLHEALRKKALS